MTSRRSLIHVLIAAVAISSCSAGGPSATVVGTIDDFTPPETCDAPSVPVDPAEGPFLFLVCGEPYVNPLYPAPFRWFGGDDDLESAIAFIVRGESDRAAELGLWSGFDFVLEGERALLNIDVAVEDRLATIRVTNVDGIEWQPPTQMMSSLGDVAMFVDVLAATALQYDGVDAVDLSVCPPYGPSQHCAPLQRSDLRARHPSDWNVAPSCSLLDYWTVPDCSPANR